MSKPLCLVTGGATDRMIDCLGQTFELIRANGVTDEVLDSHGDRIEYVLSMYHGGVQAPMMDRMPNLKVVSNYGVGYDGVDTPAAVERGIIVTHTPDVLNDEVANTTILLMLAVARNFLADNAYLKAGRWATEGEAPLSRSVKGSTVGILGLGRIGLAIAEKLQVFGVDVVYHTRTKRDAPYRYYDDLVAMARDSDTLICILPGGAATKHIVNREVLDALGPQGTLINIARGSVVDEQALITALQDGRLGWAGLDVFENEPHVPAELMAMENVTLLPHVGSGTVETRQAMGDLAVENLTAHAETGKTVTPVPECKHM